jgi:broad specificity phosphatase PhoE
MPYQIILMRHGQSEGNALGVLQGQSDYPLSARGVQQAEAVARRWKSEGRSFDVIVASPLTRARQTAEIVGATLGAPVELDPDWLERNNGRLAGLRPDEIDARGLRPGFIHIYEPVGETGESQWELFLRAGRAVQGLINRPPGCYLVVTHGGILNLAMYAILGISPQANMYGPRFRFRNTSFAVLEYDPTRHTWMMDRLNDRAHWRTQED